MVNTFNAIQPWNDHLPLPDVPDWQLRLYDSMSGQSLVFGSVVAGVIVGACLVLLTLRLLQTSELQAKAAQLYTFSMLNLFFVAVSFVVLVILVETQKVILRESQQLTYISALPYTFLFLSSLVVLILLHLKSLVHGGNK